MSSYGNVYETIVDGSSGLSSESANSCVMVGVCSKGTVGKKYYIGKNSNLSALGSGPLVQRIKHFFMNAPEDWLVIAVPSSPSIAGATAEITATQTGNAAFALQGAQKYGATFMLQVVKAGKLNSALAKVSSDAGQTYGNPFVIPVNGEVELAESGLKIKFTEGTPADNSFQLGDSFTVTAKSPQSSLAEIISAVEVGMDGQDPEFIYVAQPTNNVFWSAFGVKADEYFDIHRPVYFICESVEKTATQDIDDYVSALITMSESFAHRFVSVCGVFGDITDDTIDYSTNPGGFLAGLVASARVNQSIGEVATFPISNITLPEGWTDAHSQTLDDSGYVVLRKYAGLKNYYFANGNMMAESISDYQYFEIVRTVFKAIKLARVAALKNLHKGGDANGLAKTKDDIETALSTMLKAFPSELDSYAVIMPSGQDIANNGLAYELELYGIPIIRSIKLYFKYKLGGE